MRATLTGCAIAAAAVVALPAAGRSAEVLDSLIGPSAGYTVVDFAASWCVPCRRSLPLLEGIARQHPELRVVVVTVDERKKDWDRMAASLDLGLEVIWDESHAIAEYFSPPAMPATFVVDPGGKVVHSHTGFDRATWQEFVTVLDQLPDPASGSGTAQPRVRSPSDTASDR